MSPFLMYWRTVVETPGGWGWWSFSGFWVNSFEGVYIALCPPPRPPPPT